MIYQSRTPAFFFSLLLFSINFGVCGYDSYIIDKFLAWHLIFHAMYHIFLAVCLFIYNIIYQNQVPFLFVKHYKIPIMHIKTSQKWFVMMTWLPFWRDTYENKNHLIILCFTCFICDQIIFIWSSHHTSVSSGQVLSDLIN